MPAVTVPDNLTLPRLAAVGARRYPPGPKR